MTVLFFCFFSGRFHRVSEVGNFGRPSLGVKDPWLHSRQFLCEIMLSTGVPVLRVQVSWVMFS